MGTIFQKQASVALGLALLGADALACPPEEARRIEDALRSAPLVSEPPPNRPDAPSAPERTCALPQAEIIRAVLGRCQPRPDQSVLLLGAGRCLQQAGFRQEAAATYRKLLAALPADRTVSPERARDRRDRVRRWMIEMGEEAPPTASLILRSNVSGAQVRHLAGYPEDQTVVLGGGDTRIGQPPGERRLSLSLQGFSRVELPVDLVDGAETRGEVDWRRHVQPKYSFLLQSWDDWVKSGLTPSGYADSKRRPIAVAVSVLGLAAGAVLIGVCAGNAGDVCDAQWKQGVTYGAGALLGGAGLVGLFSSLGGRSERRLPPTLPTLPPPPAAPAPAAAPR